jgi:uridine phosphorylase
VPEVVVLEFDGDLYDQLVAKGAPPCTTWACFHTPMCVVAVDGFECGVVPRTIGGPYATLVAEQLFASGARVVLGLTSAGRVRRGAPLPHLVVADAAIRDEGTSLHYLPASRTVEGSAALAEHLAREVATLPLPHYRGLLWTTDAPYRETRSMLELRASEGALAVEMQAASLFALARAKSVQVGVVAYVTNAVDAAAEPFDKGQPDLEERLLYAMCRAARAHAGTTTART